MESSPNWLLNIKRSHRISFPWAIDAMDEKELRETFHPGIQLLYCDASWKQTAKIFIGKDRKIFHFLLHQKGIYFLFLIPSQSHHRLTTINSLMMVPIKGNYQSNIRINKGRWRQYPHYTEEEVLKSMLLHFYNKVNAKFSLLI